MIQNNFFRCWQLPLRQNKELRWIAVGWIALVVSTVAGSTFTIFARPLSQVLSPLSLVFLGESGIAFFILLSFGMVPLLREIFALKRKQFLFLLILGLLASLALALWFKGLQTTAVANAELFGRIDLFFFLALASIVLHERIGRTHWLAVCIVLLGVSIVALRGFSEMLTMRPGDFYIVGGTLTFSVVSIMYKKYLHDLRPELVLFFRAAVAIGVFFLVSPFIAHPFIDEIRSLPWTLVPVLLGFTLISRFLNVFAFYESVERLPLTTIYLASQFGLVLTIILAVVFLDEPIFWYHIFGGALVILGSFLVQLLGLHPTEGNGKNHMKMHHRHHL